MLVQIVERLYFPEISCMKNLSLKALSRNAIILACIIGVVRLLMYISFFQMPQGLWMLIYLIFPHEVFKDISMLLLWVTRSPFLQDFPLFSLLLSVLLVRSAAQLKKGNTVPLKLCYAGLIVSIVTAIPGLITGYFHMLKQYNRYVANRPATEQGVLGLIDSFALVSKPSLPLLIAQLVILLVYAAWSGWQIKSLYALDKKPRLSP
jgi:hypothetical protein